MYELSFYQAAKRLGCNVTRVRMLRTQEILSSLCADELDAYAEKAPLIHDEDFHQLMLSLLYRESA